MLGHGILREYVWGTCRGDIYPKQLYALRTVLGRFLGHRAVLPFFAIEIILSCFQTGRMNQWARAHFFVGRDKWLSAEASLLEVPADEALAVCRSAPV